MAAPDIGLAPPPPIDVASQMRPSSGGPAGGMDLSGLLAQLTGGSQPTLSADLTPKILEIVPILSQLARQVPAIGPDVDRLNVELKSRMGGLPMAIAGLSGGMPPAGAAAPDVAGALPGGPTPLPGPPGLEAGAGPLPPSGLGAAPPGPMGPGAMPPPGALPMPPTPVGTMGALDTAMQLEIKLPDIGKDDPSLMPYIQGFIARMRQEVPKVVQGETEAINPPVQAAPTDSMLSKIPVTY